MLMLSRVAPEFCKKNIATGNQSIYNYSPPTRELCAADGCGNEKKYSCSKTGVPLCSLHCYKMNMSKVQSMKDLPVPVT